MNKRRIQIGDIVTATERFTRRKVKGEFTGYQLESKDNPDVVVGCVLDRERQLWCYVDVDSIVSTVSEDEATRRMIVDQMKNWKRAAAEECCSQDIEDANRALDWLENHKEPEAKMPMWRKIKAGEHLPEPSYIWKFAYENENNFLGKCHVDGFLLPNIACQIGCDTWYLPIADIKNLPKEE